MTTTAVADGLLGVGLTDHKRERVGSGRPDSHAPKKAHDQSEVEVVAAGIGSRLQDVTVLSILAATQLSWMAALGYGLLHLLK